MQKDLNSHGKDLSIGLIFSFKVLWHYLSIYVVSAKIPQNEYTADMQFATLIFLLLVVGVAGISIIFRNRLRKKYRW